MPSAMIMFVGHSEISPALLAIGVKLEISQLVYLSVKSKTDISLFIVLTFWESLSFILESSNKFWSTGCTYWDFCFWIQSICVQDKRRECWVIVISLQHWENRKYSEVRIGCRINYWISDQIFKIKTEKLSKLWILHLWILKTKKNLIFVLTDMIIGC